MIVDEAVKLRNLDLCEEHHITLNKLSTLREIMQSTLNNIISRRNATTQIICDGLKIAIFQFFSSPLLEKIEQEIK